MNHPFSLLALRLSLIGLPPSVPHLPRLPVRPAILAPASSPRGLLSHSLPPFQALGALKFPSSEQEVGVYPGILTGFVAGGGTAQSRAAKPEAPGWEDFCDTHFLSFLSVLDSGHRLEESGLPQAQEGGNEEQAQRQGARCSETHSMQHGAHQRWTSPDSNFTDEKIGAQCS